jgi:hypothetical protein
MFIVPDEAFGSWITIAGMLDGPFSQVANVEPQVDLVSFSVDARRLATIARQLGLKKHQRRAIRHTRRYGAPHETAKPYTYVSQADPRYWVSFEREYGAQTSLTTPVFSEQTALSFDSPVEFTRVGMTHLLIAGSPLDWIPRRDFLAAMVIRNADFEGDWIRIRTYAMQRFNLEATFPLPHAVVEELLNRVCLSHANSDKGKIGVALSQQFEIDHLLEPGVYTAIRVLTTRRARDLMRELARTKSGSRADLVAIAAEWGGRTERRYRTVQQVVSEAGIAAGNALERLAELGWAERGFELRCPSCLMATFISLADITTPPACPGCGQSGRYSTADRVPVLVYRLNTIFDRTSDQGVLPHLMVVAHLHREDPASYVLPGVNVEVHELGRGEVDLFGVTTKQVVAGEVKSTAAQFTQRQIRRDLSLSRALAVDAHLVATPEVIPSTDRERLASYRRKTDPAIRFIDGTDFWPDALT